MWNQIIILLMIFLEKNLKSGEELFWFIVSISLE